jgi:hypothetical protein
MPLALPSRNAARAECTAHAGWLQRNPRCSNCASPRRLAPMGRFAPHAVSARGGGSFALDRSDATAHRLATGTWRRPNGGRATSAPTSYAGTRADHHKVLSHTGCRHLRHPDRERHLRVRPRGPVLRQRHEPRPPRARPAVVAMVEKTWSQQGKAAAMQVPHAMDQVRPQLSLSIIDRRPMAPGRRFPPETRERLAARQPVVTRRLELPAVACCRIAGPGDRADRSGSARAKSPKSAPSRSAPWRGRQSCTLAKMAL